MSGRPPIRLLREGAAGAAAQMDRDRSLFEAYDPALHPPLLRLYGWAGRCVTAGYSAGEEELAGLDLKPGVAAARRPTGGGLVLHDRDLAFALMLPPNLFGGLRASYRAVGLMLIEALADGLEAQGLRLAAQTAADASAWCFSAPEDYDIVEARGRKVCGIAQRRKRDKLLFQGSLTLSPPCPENFLKSPPRPLADARAAGLEEVLGRPLEWNETADAIAAGFSRAFRIRYTTI